MDARPLLKLRRKESSGARSGAVCPVVWASPFMRDRNHLNSSIQFAVYDFVRKSRERNSADIGCAFNAMAMWRVSYILHNLFKLQQVVASKPCAAGFIKPDGFIVLGFGERMKPIDHRSKVRALRLTSSEGASCTVPLSISAALRSASSSQSCSTSVSGSASRLSRSLCAKAALAGSGKCIASFSIVAISIGQN